MQFIMQWKQIERFPQYEVNDLGQIRHIEEIQLPSACRILRRRQPFTKMYINNSGYKVVGLYNFATQKTITVAVAPLVAHAFLGPRPSGTQINHINGVKTDNYISNLEWVTQSKNIRHAYDTGLHKVRIGSVAGKSLSQAQYDDIINMWNRGVSQVRIAKQYNINNATVSKIVNGKCKPRKFLTAEEKAARKHPRVLLTEEEKKQHRKESNRKWQKANPEKWRKYRRDATKRSRAKKALRSLRTPHDKNDGQMMVK